MNEKGRVLNMKKEYKAPLVKKIDFEYDEQVTATSEMGVEARPYNPVHCQYLASANMCKIMVGGSYICDTPVFSLRR